MVTHNIAKGLSYSLSGYLAMALMSVCAKGLAHLPVSMIIFSQFFIGFCFSLPAVMRKNIGLKTTQPYLMLMRALTGLLSLCAMLLAMRYIPLVSAVVLQNTIPLFVPLVALIWLRKKIPHRLWSGLIIGFAGVILIVKPNASIFDPMALIGLSAGLLSAISMVCVAQLKKTEPTARISFYFLLIGAVVSLPFMLTHWAVPTSTDILLLVGVGLFTYLGQTLVTHGFLFGNTHTLASLSYTTVVFTGLLGWALWGHIPDPLSLGGVVLVIVGGIITILLDQHKSVTVTPVNVGAAPGGELQQIGMNVNLITVKSQADNIKQFSFKQ